MNGTKSASRSDRAWTLYPGVRCLFGEYIVADEFDQAIAWKTLEPNTMCFQPASDESRQACAVRGGL